MFRRLAPHVAVILCVIGLAFLAAAAWVVGLPFGLAATGVACLVLEWRVDR